MENSLLHHNASDAFTYFGISDESIKNLEGKLCEKHRFYHNYEHINDILKMIDSYHPLKYGNYNMTSVDRKILLAAALYHDAIYDPLKKDNEEKSAECFLRHCQGANRYSESLQVVTIIKDTAKHTPSTKLSQIFCDFDLHGLKEAGFHKMLVNENNLFLEFQKIDYSKYKEGRIEFLESFLEKNNNVNESNIKALIDYVKFRVPKIGIYAGSFNPFHKGHMNILEKAEKIFDKVIISIGINPEKKFEIIYKKDRLEELQRKLNYRQIETFDGNLADYITSKSIDCDTTLIRGLRNGYDLSYEVNQFKYTKKFNPDVKSIFIHCDQEFEHISSTDMRNMIKSGDEKMIEEAKNCCKV